MDDEQTSSWSDDSVSAPEDLDGDLDPEVGDLETDGGDIYDSDDLES